MSVVPAPVVYKFGGTSVGDGARIRHVARLAAEGPRPLVVVVSAMAGVTDLLQQLVADPGRTDEVVDTLRTRHLEALEQIAPAPEAAEGTRALLLERLERLRADGSGAEVSTPRMRGDRVLSAGEDLSQRLVTAALEAAGVPAVAVDARSVVVTDPRFGRAAPDRERTRDACARTLGPELVAGKVAVVQGFVGGTPDGYTTTLGRGGSDFSGAILGGALSAESIHIWTDVVGVSSLHPLSLSSGLNDAIFVHSSGRPRR